MIARRRHAERPGVVGGSLRVLLLLCAPAGGAGQAGERPPPDDDHGHLMREAIPLQIDAVANRPPPLIEIGEKFLSSGPLSGGLKLPTGAIWRPALWVFGTYRSAVQSFNVVENNPDRAEWGNRFDIFANLRLSGTERVLIGFRPFDDLGGVGYNFQNEDGWQDDFNDRVETLFFEGDVGELFPFLDDDDHGSLDLGFAVGRQDLVLQEGILLADNIDAFGLTRNSLRPTAASNLRMTALYGWGDVHRGAGLESPSVKLVALSTETDLRFTTIAFDLVYTLSVDSASGDGLYGGLSATQRLGRFNTAFRLNVSAPLNDATLGVESGGLFLTEVSWTPHGYHDNIYFNTFAAVGEFTPAARRQGGPLARSGILFESPGIGRFGSPLDSRADDVVGGSLGYQRFANHGRTQVILEASGLKNIDGGPRGAGGLGLRIQQALGRRFVVRIDGFGTWRQTDDHAFGGRLESLVKF